MRLLLARISLGAFAAQFVLLEAFLRGRSGAFSGWAGGIAIAASLLGWGLGARATTRPAGRWALAALAAVLVTFEVSVFRFYGVFVDGQLARSALHSWADVAPVLARAAVPALGLGLAVLSVELLLLTLAAPLSTAPFPRGRRAKIQLAAALALVATLLLAPRGQATPDLELLRAAAGGHRAEARTASLAPRPAVDATLITGSRSPAVLFVLTESVRASDYADDSGTHPAIDALLPDRITLYGMRSLASYTAVSVAALLTGQPQLGRRDELLTAPDLFTETRRRRTERGVPRTAYYSAHTRAVFEGRPVPTTVDTFVSLETLLGHDVDDEGPEFDKGYDGLLTTRFVADEALHAGPGVTMLHFAGTHVPYFVDETNAPFQPFTRRVSWSDLPALHNAYKNSILAQDRHVAATVASFVRAQHGGPWVVIFTSDHGEAFGERGGIHHGQNLRSEQVRVPAWLASGGGALTEAELAAARDHRERVTTHLDVLPTLLDTFHRDGASTAMFAGRSLLRPIAAPTTLPVTNCTSFFPCPLDTWGLVRGDVEVLAQPWDGDWQCLRLDASAAGRDDESLALDVPECATLREASRRFFATRPGGKANE